MIGVDEEVFEVEAIVTGTGTGSEEEVEEYSKFVIGFGMNVVGMLLPGDRGRCKTGGSAIPRHNYVRSTQKEGKSKRKVALSLLDFYAQRGRRFTKELIYLTHPYYSCIPEGGV